MKILYQPHDMGYSRLLQKYAFKLGYRWGGNSTEAQHIGDDLWFHPEDKRITFSPKEGRDKVMEAAAPFRLVTSYQEMRKVLAADTPPDEAPEPCDGPVFLATDEDGTAHMSNAGQFTTPHEDTTMSKFTIKDRTFINGLPAADIPDEALFGLMGEASAEADHLEVLVAKDVTPNKLTTRVREIRQFIVDLSEYIDNR